MVSPNPSGGPQHLERIKNVGKEYNSHGSSNALFAGQPNEPGWAYEGEIFKDEPARQCQAQESPYRHCSVCDTTYNETNSATCPECGSFEYYKNRCPNRAEPGRTTCKGHGGTTKLTKEQSDKRVVKCTAHGLNVAEIMLCPCLHKDTCPYAGQLVDKDKYGSSVPRCLPEAEFYDATVEHFRNTYDLDPAADQVMLNRLVMSMLRIMRGEKIIAQYGEIVERTRASPDGSYETWWEQSAVAKTVDALDRRVQSWLKELNVSRAAREGKKLTIQKNVDISTVLSRKDISDDIIDIEFEEQ